MENCDSKLGFLDITLMNLVLKIYQALLVVINFGPFQTWKVSGPNRITSFESVAFQLTKINGLRIAKVPMLCLSSPSGPKLSIHLGTDKVEPISRGVTQSQFKLYTKSAHPRKPFLKKKICDGFKGDFKQG